MPKRSFNTHVVEWEWLIAVLDGWETEPPPPGEGGDGPRGDHHGK